MPLKLNSVSMVKMSSKCIPPSTIPPFVTSAILKKPPSGVKH
jgi:hypothetical protein